MFTVWQSARGAHKVDSAFIFIRTRVLVVTNLSFVGAVFVGLFLRKARGLRILPSGFFSSTLIA